jgi:hypothetical protein
MAKAMFSRDRSPVFKVENIQFADHIGLDEVG